MNRCINVVYLVIFLLIISTVSADIIINEIMYNPNQCSDTYCEWVELYNNGSMAVNLSGWTLEGNGFDDPVIDARGYLVVARKLDGSGDSFEKYWGNGDGVWNETEDGFRAVDGNFGTGLANGGETVSLTNGTYTNNIDYTNYTGFGNGNGYTLSRNWSDEWIESSEINGTPGAANFPEPVQSPIFNNWINPTTNNTMINGLLNITVNISYGNITYVNFNGTNYTMLNSSDVWYYLWNTSLNNDGSYNITVYYNGSETLHNITVDNSGPSVTFISPQDLGMYQGVITINASVTDSSDVNNVFFELWNASSSNLINISASKNGDYYYAYLNSTNYTDGTYYIYATANDSLNNINESEFAEITIGNKIQANAGSDQNVSEGVLVSFNGSASFSSANITSYFWEFDDGSNATGAEPTHLFSENGVYFVNLTITDMLNRTSTDEAIITVEDVDAIANFTVSDNLIYENNETLVLNASVSTPYNGYDNITAYYWIINYTYTDKTGTYLVAEYYSGISLEKIFYDNGPYTAEVTLIVQDEDSNSSISKNVNVLFNNDNITIEAVLPDVVIDEGSSNASIDLDDYFDDEETADDDISFSVSGNNNVNINIDSGHVMNVSSSWIGEENITITALDENGSSIEQTFTVTVDDVMYAPEIIGTIPDIAVDEDSGDYSIDLTSYESDVEDSDIDLTWSLNGVNSNLLSYSINSIEDIITFTPKANAHGTDSIFFILTDSDNLTDQQMIVFTVNSINDLPNITSYYPTDDTLYPDVNDSLSFNVSYEDIDSIPSVSWYVNDNLQSTGDSFSYIVNDSSVTVKYVLVDEDYNTSRSWSVIPNVPPKYSTFNGSTTNFSAYNQTELANLSDVVLEKSPYGKIEFISGVDARGADFDNCVIISQDVIGINQSCLPAFENEEAVVTFYHLAYNGTPVIYYNDGFLSSASSITAVCDFCTLLNYDAAPTTDGMINFSASHFTVFTGGNESNGTQENQSQNQTQENQTSALIIKEIKVYVDGDREKDADENGGIIDNVKPGDNIELKIELENNGSLEIKYIDIEGIIYDIDDGDDIEEDDDINKLKPGKEDDAKLEFKIPLEVEEKDFLLELDIEGEDENDTKQKAYVNFTVRIEKKKHEIEILRADVSSSLLECSRTADLEVKAINLGRDDEDEVRITAKNSALGINFEKKDIELETDPDDDNTYATTFDLFLDDASAGTYTIDVKAYYDEDEESDSEDVMLTIKDCVKTKKAEVKEETKSDISEVVFTTIPSQFKTNTIVEKEYTFRDHPLFLPVIVIMFILLSGMVVLLIGAIIIKK